MSQSDFMEKDTVLVLNESDIVVGSESKRSSHIFSKERPRAVVHRAFSVFLFDEQTGELLLQRRAASKVTFPNVSSPQTINRYTYSHRFWVIIIILSMNFLHLRIN